MRIAPLAVWLANIDDLETLKTIIEVDVGFTHSNQLVKHAVVVYAASIGYLIRNYDEEGK
jgi:ADP-ribosylglycohydrolase